MPVKDQKTVRCHAIVKLYPKEGSFTPHGANDRANLILIKELFGSLLKDGMEPEEVVDPPSTADLLAGQDMWTKWNRIRDAFNEACWQITESAAEDKPARLVKATQEFASLLEQAFSTVPEMADLMKAVEAQVEAFAMEARASQVWDHNKLSTALDVLEKDARPTPPANAAGEENSMQKFLEQFRKLDTLAQRATLEKEVPAEDRGALLVALTPPARVAIRKEDLPEEVRLQLEAGEAAAAKVAKLEKEQLLTLCKEEARGLGLSNAPAVEALLLKAHSGEAIAPEALVAVLKSSAEQAADAQKILTQQAGHPGSPTAKPGSATAKLEALAKAHQSANPHLSSAQAMSKAMSENPALAEQMDKEG